MSQRNKEYEDKIINKCLWFLGILSIFILSGCFGTPEPLQSYPGPKLPDSKVAILIRASNVTYLNIDGEYKDLNGIGSVAILPGQHEIKWTVNHTVNNTVDRPYDRTFSLKNSGTLNAKAGKRYYLYVDFHGTGPYMGLNTLYDFRTIIAKFVHTDEDGEIYLWGTYVESEDFTPH